MSADTEQPPPQCRVCLYPLPWWMKKEKVNHSDAQRERFPLLRWWLVATSSSLNQALFSSKGAGCTAAAGPGSWGQSRALKIVPNFTRDKWVWVTQRPDGSRASPVPVVPSPYDDVWFTVWFTGVKHVALWQSDRSHMETLLSQHYENQATENTHWVWSMTEGLTQTYTRRHMHTPSVVELCCDKWHAPPPASLQTTQDRI